MNPLYVEQCTVAVSDGEIWMRGFKDFDFCETLASISRPDEMLRTFKSTYWTALREPFLICSSNIFEEFTCCTRIRPCSQTRLARGSGVASCGGMSTPMDHTSKGKLQRPSFRAALPFEDPEPETKPDGPVACGSFRVNVNGGTFRWGL